MIAIPYTKPYTAIGPVPRNYFCQPLHRTTISGVSEPLYAQECIPVGCVPAAHRPYAGVCFRGGGVSLLQGGVYSGGGVCSGGVCSQCSGVSAPGGVSALGGSAPGGSAPGGVCSQVGVFSQGGLLPVLQGGWYPSMH